MANSDMREAQRGSAEMILLALLEDGPRHGYELARLIESGSQSRLQFHLASLYPMLYRLEHKKLVAGRWVEKAGERRKRYYKLTAEGRKELARRRRSWREFVAALNGLTGFSHA